MRLRVKGRRLALGLAGMVLCVGAVAAYRREFRPRPRPAELFSIAEVRHADLFPTLSASGEVQSSKRTVIACEVENIGVGMRGQRQFAGSSSLLLSIVPEGSVVKQGDVLVRLDSSDFEELLRVQRIAVERAESDELQAQLSHEVAEMAIEGFRDGPMKETVNTMRGGILLARAELERAKERVNWARKMKAKGYVAASLVTSEEFRVSELQIDLQRQESALEIYQKFTAPRAIRQLEGTAQGAAVSLEYQKLRLKRHRERLRRIELQVERCTIRAPHDGYVIYANNPRRQVTIQEGMEVYQHQPLIYLPDLSDMEIVANLHESIVERVRPNLRAKVSIEALRGRVIEGHTTSVAPMATFDWRSDVHYFAGIVKLENPPLGLRPGMSAEVEIELPRLEHVLAIPPEAIEIENGREFCFVVNDDGLERRGITIGQTTEDLAEIKAGLKEGEQVVLNPPSNLAELGIPVKEELVRESMAQDPPVVELARHGGAATR